MVMLYITIYITSIYYCTKDCSEQCVCYALCFKFARGTFMKTWFCNSSAPKCGLPNHNFVGVYPTTADCVKVASQYIGNTTCWLVHLKRKEKNRSGPAACVLLWEVLTVASSQSNRLLCFCGLRLICDYPWTVNYQTGFDFSSLFAYYRLWSAK